MSKKKVLVTGATGLIGREVCALLAQRGHQPVATDVLPSGSSDFPVEQCDLRDVHGLNRIIGDEISAIVHCGGFSGPMHGWTAPHLVVDVNITGTENLLEIARQRGIERFVYASTAHIYGETDQGPVTESAPVKPTNIYGATKVAGESLVTAYQKQFGLDSTSLRFGWVYGPRRTTDCVIRTMLTDALEGRPTRLGFGANFPRQFIAVADAARAMVAAVEHQGELPAQLYNVTGGDYPTLEEVADHVRSVLPAADIVLKPGQDPNDSWQHQIDIRSIERDLGFAPDVSLRQGIEEYSVWLSNQ